MSLLCVWISATAQVGQQSQEPVDSIKNIGYMDSLFQELPEVMITGERPIVKAEQGKLVYDVPRLVGNLPVDNAYDVVKNLPGIVNMNNSLMLGGQEVTVVINGKVTTLSAEQLDALLKSIPVSRIEKAEVMYSAPARYQVRGPMINLILAPGTGQASSLQGELYTAFNQHHYESLAERGSLLYSGRKFSADLLYSYSYDRDRRITEKEALHTLADGSAHQMDMDEAKQYVEDLRKDNPKVADIMSHLINEIELDESRFKGKSILNIVENMKHECIEQVVSNFCLLWHADKDDVMYAATHYRNGVIPNESAIKASINYPEYKNTVEHALPKFKYYAKFFAELRSTLDDEIKPLV